MSIQRVLLFNTSSGDRLAGLRWTALSVAMLVFAMCLMCGELNAQDFSGSAVRGGSPADKQENHQDTVKSASAWRYGAFAGIGLGFHSASFAELPGVPSCCPGYREGTSWMPSLALLADYNFNDQYSAEMRLGWAVQNGTITRRQIAGNALAGSQTVDALVDHNLEVDLSNLNTDLGLRYHHADNWPWFEAGVQLAWSLGGNFKQDETLVEPVNAVFDDGRAIRNERSGSIADLTAVRLGLQAGLSWELPVAERLSLAPTVRYTWHPQNVVKGLDWTINTLEFGLALRFDPENRIIRNTPELPAEPQETPLADLPAPQSADTIVRPTQPNPFVNPAEKNTAAGELRLTVVGIAADGRRISDPTLRIFRHDSREYLPLLSQIFFPPGSADLGESRQNLVNNIDAQKFAENELSGSILDIYYDNLNIVGERMLRFPSAGLTLTGRMPAGNWTAEDSLVALRRARAVRDYFVNVWEVDTDRIAIRTAPDNVAVSQLNKSDWQEEQRRVEISSDNYEVTAPVFVRTAADRVEPEVLEYVPIWSGDTPDAWSMTLETPSGFQRVYIGDGQPGALRFNVPAREFAPIDTELRAGLELTAADQSIRVAEAVVPVEWSADLNTTGEDVRREKFSLILFDYNSDELLNNNRRILDLVRSRIEPASVVTVLGYADRTGTPQFNRGLASRRCNNVRDYLVERGVSVQSVSVQAVGSDILLHDNALPEGRSYSRTVQILVVTPLE